VAAAAVGYQQWGRIEIWPKQWKSTCGHFIDNTHLATYAAMQERVEVARIRGWAPRQGEHFPRKCNANAAESQPISYHVNIVKLLKGCMHLRKCF